MNISSLYWGHNEVIFIPNSEASTNSYVHKIHAEILAR